MLFGIFFKYLVWGYIYYSPMWEFFDKYLCKNNKLLASLKIICVL